MSWYPLLLELEGRPVLLAGGGPVAARKLAALLKAGALVRLVSPELCPQARELLGSGVDYHPREIGEADLEGVELAFLATGSLEANRRGAEWARARGVWANLADAPEACDFLVPASFKRGRLTVALNTAGASPAAARLARERLEGEFGPEWEPFLEIMAAARRHVLARNLPQEENRRLFHRLAGADLLGLVARGDRAGVDGLLVRVLGAGGDLKALGLEGLGLPGGKDGGE